VKRSYHVVACSKRGAARTLAAFCRTNGQVLLPLVELVEQARLAVDTVIEQVSQQTLETILDLSAEQLAGVRTPGKPSGPIRWHGRQTGRVSLADRQMAVNRPPASLREGLEETFTLNRLGLPPSLHRCLATTNLIESPQSGVRKRTGNVCRWRDADMVLRWVAGAYLATEKHFRRIQGYEDLWVLAAALGRANKSVTPQEKVA
jgi:hypothetical protein